MNNNLRNFYFKVEIFFNYIQIIMEIRITLLTKIISFILSRKPDRIDIFLITYKYPKELKNRKFMTQMNKFMKVTMNNYYNSTPKTKCSIIIMDFLPYHLN